MASTYDRLVRSAATARDAETQLEILRHLELVDVPESQRAGVRALQRVHFERFVRLQQRQRKETIERISSRRSELRARTESHQPPRTASAVKKVVDTPARQSTVKQQAQTGTAPPFSYPPPAPVGTSAQHGGMSGPQLALSELLKKKSSAVGVEDDADNYNSDTMLLPPPRSIAERPLPGRNPFQTAGQKLEIDRLHGRHSAMDEDEADGRQRQRGGRGLSRQTPRSSSYHPINPNLLLGGAPSSSIDEYDDDDGCPVRKKFVSPIVRPGEEKKPAKSSMGSKNAQPAEEEEDIDPRLKSCDPDLIAKIEMEIVDYGDPVTFDDIAGLQFAKRCVNELVIWPMARPDIFTGLRSLPKGLLLFGPPGTGKTLIGKAIANQSGATFFSISASSLTSKWIGEGEKLVRTLFAVAAVKQPSVIFIDEIDSLLTQRSSEENEASRRMKTEFLVQLDGAGTKADDVILVVGATNRPQELDEAARRRFVKRLYIPLPSLEARLDLINRLLRNNKHDLSDDEKKVVAEKTKGYSGADVRALCTEAAMGPIRSCPDIRTMDADAVRPISLEDFNAALRGVRSSVATKDLEFYREWNAEFGSFEFVGHED
ncbi:hypothetical protein PINS_up004672 [Pythium insidiosum]|nr:hypothetical protein PINS_up004672 [Pythium insidiosum]